MEYERPNVTVDVALFALRKGRLCVLLAPRTAEPHAGVLALPGGYVHVDEDADTEATARRVLMQKIGTAVPYVEQLYTFSGIARDPRGWSVSVAYYALLPEGSVVLPEGALFMPVDAVEALDPPLPFDHLAIVAKAVERLRGKSTYSGLPLFLLGREFTMREVQAVYETVLGETLPAASFRRRVEEQGLVRARGYMRVGKANRPAQLYEAV